MNQLPQNPIFIVGYPRSGTTLLQRLLVTQPGVYSFPETHYFCVIEKQLLFNENRNILPSCLNNVFEKIAEKMEFRFTTEETNLIINRAHENRLSSKDLFENIVIRFLIHFHPVVQRLHTFNWIEKTPNHAHFLERIVEFYPDAHILHIVRHPVPAIFSRKLKFPFNKDIPLEELARRWNRILEDIEDFSELFPGNIYTFRYEDLVEDTETELAAVGDFLNISINPDLLSSIKQKNYSESFVLPSETWKLNDLARDVSNTNEDYRKLITPQEAESIEMITLKGMIKYGYQPYY